MIPNHAKFIAALADQKKVCVRFLSHAGNGVQHRVCAPMNFGPGSASQDDLNRYWLWDYAGTNGVHTLGLAPQQVVELSVLGEDFDASVFAGEPSTVSVALRA